MLCCALLVSCVQIPLVLSFFSTEDRIHALKSEELQQVVNSVLFEPARFLHADVTGKLPPDRLIDFLRHLCVVEYHSEMMNK